MGMREDNFMISNGQGVSSPSYWQGLSQQNPAGLIYNQRLKIQAGGAAFSDNTNNLRGSAGLFMGNGLIAGGAEYSKYSSGPYPSGSAQVNWGLAAKLETAQTTFGISGHHVTPHGGSAYDAGILIDLTPSLRFGGMIPNFTNGLHTVAGGFTAAIDPMVDFVIDAAYQLTDSDGIVKPGLNIHSDILQVSAAYGIRFAGNYDPFLYARFSAGVGLRLADNLLVQYEYRVLPQHLVGVTLRF